MFSQNPFVRMQSPSRWSEGVRSAILNCICPECGGALLLASKQFRCRGKCGIDWRPVWLRMRQSDQSHHS